MLLLDMETSTIHYVETQNKKVPKSDGFSAALLDLYVTKGNSDVV